MSKHTLTFLAFLAASPLAWTQPALDRRTGHVSAQPVTETKALLASLNKAIDRQQAQLDTSVREATARAKWSDQDRARFFQTVLRSSPNSVFTERIESLTGGLRAMLQASQQGKIKGPAADCCHVVRLRELVGLLMSVHEEQTAYLTQQLRNVGPRSP